MKANAPTNVIVVIGAGLIGQAIARRIGAGKHIVLADLRPKNAETAARIFHDAGFSVSTAKVDVSSRESVHALVEGASSKGEITGLIHAAGVSPSQAPPDIILKVDLYGAALVLEEFGKIIAPGGAGVVIASMSGASPASAFYRAGQAARNDAGGRASRTAHASAGPGEGPTSRLPNLQTRKLVARDGGSRPLGEKRCAG